MDPFAQQVLVDAFTFGFVIALLVSLFRLPR